jgi:hypothetical protein
MGMIDKAGHIAWAADAVAVFQNHCGTGDEHAIADLICDLGQTRYGEGMKLVSHTSPFATVLRVGRRRAADVLFAPGVSRHLMFSKPK